MPTATPTPIPRWRGFNLLDLFHSQSDGNFSEDDFRWIADWGFDFVRLPMCYLLWVDDDDPLRINDSKLEPIDRAIDLGEKHGLHVDLNFHRAPGYSVNTERDEPFSLWRDEEALEAFCLHWETLAKRYHGIPSDRLSFNLVNEPKNPTEAEMTRDDHERVMRAAVERIRAVDPDRLIIVDGLSWGNETCPELADLGVAQSCRAYQPMSVSHYKASWVNGENWDEPTWPGSDPWGNPWDRQRLEQHYAPWLDLARKGVGVHCGEGGAYSHTPHEVFLAWFRDVLEILTPNGIGFALWNFHGSFGILDSERADVDYEDWYGHKLDRQLLDLLQQF